MECQKVKIGQPVNSGKGGQQYSNCLFYAIFGKWFLYRNPKWPRKDSIVWRQFIAHRLFLEIPRNIQIKRKQNINHDHTKFSIPIRLKL